MNALRWITWATTPDSPRHVQGMSMSKLPIIVVRLLRGTTHSSLCASAWERGPCTQDATSPDRGVSESRDRNSVCSAASSPWGSEVALMLPSSNYRISRNKR
jgi:hypothetical protein